MRLDYDNEAQWHDLRATRIGASEAASLFGCGYQSVFELWHEKKGNLPHPDFTDNERIVVGRCLEEGIAQAASELFSPMQLIKAKGYYVDDAIEGLGASPDYFWMRDGEPIAAEVKNCSWGAYRDDWVTQDDGEVEPPLRFLIQVQTQLACTNAQEGLLIALIAGNRLIKCHIPRHEPAIAAIRQRTVAFWESVRTNVEPPAEMPHDLWAAKRVWPAGEGSIDLCGDPDIEGWVEQMAELRTARKRIEVDEETIRGHLLRYCKDNSYATIKCNAGRISCKKQGNTDGTVLRVTFPQGAVQ